MNQLTISLIHQYFCALILLVVSISSIYGGNSTSNEEQNDNPMIEHEYYGKNFTRVYNDKAEQNNFRSNSTDKMQLTNFTIEINNREDNDTVEYEIELTKSQKSQYVKPTQVEINANFSNLENRSDSAYDLRENSTVDGGKKNIIQLCCPYGHRLSLKTQECIAAVDVDYVFPNVTDSDEPFDRVFDLVVQDPCTNDDVMHYMINSVEFPDSVYYFSTETSSAYFPHFNVSRSASSYCLAVVNRNNYEFIICKNKPKRQIYVTVALVVSLPFFLMTFVVYSVLSELRNMHGYMLRAHIASLFVSYMILPVFREVFVNNIDYSLCVTLSIVLTFSFLSSFFWLNVTCFDIWWTFGGFQSIYKGRVKPKREKKTFVVYSMYAWGIPFVIAVLVAIMNFTSALNLPQPKFCTVKCWFTDKARLFYVNIPIYIILICNICLFVYTAVKILWHKRSTDHDLRGSQSQRHDDNKQRFLMYIKLFIMMGVSWIMEAMTFIFTSTPYYVWLLPDMINGLQGVIIFVIFVCKRKIIRMLMKRFNCKENSSLCCCASFLSSDSSVSQSTVTTRSADDVSMQQIESSN